MPPLGELLETKRRTLARLGRRGDDVATDYVERDLGVRLPCSKCGHDCRATLTVCGARCPECGAFTVYRHWFPRRPLFGGMLDRRGSRPLRLMRRLFVRSY